MRHLARVIRDKTGWGSQSALWQFLEGRLALTEPALENVARAFNVSPSYFPEYRLMMARRELDPDEVGLARALETLAKCPVLDRTS